MDASILLTSQTLTTLMMKLKLCSCHSQIHDLTKVKVTRVEPPITLIVSDLSSGLAVAHSLAPAVLPKAQGRAPPIIWHSLGGWLIVGTCLDYGNLMV